MYTYIYIYVYVCIYWIQNVIEIVTGTVIAFVARRAERNQSRDGIHHITSTTRHHPFRWMGPAPALIYAYIYIYISIY